VAPGTQPEEAKVHAVLEDLRKNQRREMMNVSPKDGRFLRLLAAASQARRGLEIGTSNGYSGIWIALGLRENGGKLVTLELDPQRAALAQNAVRTGPPFLPRLWARAVTLPRAGAGA
jgi:predicted O-methyltransferase YrrM